MKPEEAKKMAAYACNLFGITNIEQGKYLAEKLVPYSVRVAESAIKDHRTNHSFLEFPALMEGLRTAQGRAETSKKRHDQERIIDWLRRSFTNIHGKEDRDVLIDHFLSCVRAVEKVADGHGRREGMQTIRGHILMAFREIEFPESEAREMADTIAPILKKGLVIADQEATVSP